MRTVEALAFQFAGQSAWHLRWVLIDTETGEIFMFMDQKCDMGGFCGMLSGDNPNAKLVFDRNGLVRSYFKLIDPVSNTCVGSARCLKKTAKMIVEILAG